MALTAAELQFIFGADTREVDRALGTVGRDIDRTASRGTRVMGNFWRAAGVGATAFAGGAAVFLKGAISEASNLGESVNAVNVTFGKAARGIRRLAKSAADDVGLSKTQFQGLAVQFSNFATTVAGGKGRAVVKTMDDLTTRAADFASVMNLDVNEAATLFQSGLAGETEPLRRFGIDLSAAAVQAHAYKAGIAEAGAELTEQQKVQSRYSLLMQQTSKTAGDFENTQDSLANVMRRLGAHFDNSQAKLGKGFLPALESAGKYLIDEGIPALNRFSDWFNKEGIPAIQDFAGWVMDDAVPAVKDFAGFLGDAMGHAKDLVGWLRDLPDPAKYAGLAALLGGGVVAKVRGGGGGLAGKALGAVVGVKGTPVYVTNWAQIAGGGGAGGVLGGKGSWAATAGKTFGLAAAPVIAGYLGYKVNKNLLDRRRADDTAGGAAGSDEHRKMIAGWQGAEGGANKYNQALERTRDNLLTITNGVTGFSSKAERARDKVLAVTNGIADFGDKGKNATDRVRDGLARVGGAADNARLRVRLLGADLDWVARPREARITITREFSKAGHQTIGGLQEGTYGGAGANGRLTQGGRYYLVGENGPELFEAGMTGRVISNPQSKAMLGLSPGAAGSGYVRLDPADVQAITRALLQARPVHGDVTVHGDPTVFRREMEADAHAAAYSGMPPMYANRG